MRDDKATNRLNDIASNTAALRVLLHEELTLSTASAVPLPFTGINSKDVKAVEIRVKTTGTPTDTTAIVRFRTDGTAPTASSGMYLAGGDLYTINHNANVINFKIIRIEALAHVVNIIYYGV